MNLLTINPISSCNLSCEHCPNKEWTYPIDDEQNRLNNEIIFVWLKKYIKPTEWFLEISGGEPGLYPEIVEFVNTLNKLGYYGIIRTNGTLPIPKVNNFKRIAAWHKVTTISHPPEFCDVMLITENPKDCWQDKVEYCSTNKIPYKCIPYISFGDSSAIDESSCEDKKNDFFKYWVIISSSGEQACCYEGWGSDESGNIIDLYPPILVDMASVCPSCTGTVGVLNFIDNKLRALLLARESLL